jgi:hypothetical protein
MTAASLSVAANALALCSAIATLASCNSILGIDRATLIDAGSEAGVAGDDGGDPLTCENYCAILDKACTGENLEYKTTQLCLDMCAQFFLPASQHYAYPDDPPPPDAGDTLGCRLWHAHAAQDEDPAMHCRHAGLLGYEKCGGPCQPFCRIVHDFCYDQSPPADPYDGGVRECVGVCNDGPFSYDLTRGDLRDTMMEIDNGNTLNCRLWHLETAYQLMLPQMHCPHTGEVSATCR